MINPPPKSWLKPNPPPAPPPKKNMNPILTPENLEEILQAKKGSISGPFQDLDKKVNPKPKEEKPAGRFEDVDLDDDLDKEESNAGTDSKRSS